MVIKQGSEGRKKLGWIMALYLLGLFMGAIDTGIISPARTIIQNMLGTDEKTGIWMITIYTLAYAAIIPVSGKLADRFGRKYIYIASVGLFGLGSLVCGLSNFAGSFPLLLAGRVIQALGGGGIMPIATAEFGTSFPPEKRGLALGLVGGTYGVANILGSTIGSAILNAFGNDNWHMLFYVNIPISIVIIVGGLLALPNHKADTVRKIDKVGTLVLVAMVLSLLYGLRNIDFFNFAESIRSVSVYPYLIAFACMLPLFILSERSAEDPILALRYFTRRNTLVTLGLSFLAGFCMMGMVFVPQFAENALKIATGSGGYFVAILGVFAGAAAPLSGVLIDRLGPKKVLFAGFAITFAGALFLALVAVNTGNWFTVCLSLVLIGLGLGFTMGTPLNYMMLSNTRPDESNSALAALSLVRSVGTAIAPAIMIGFLVQAGTATQDNLMNMLPKPEAPKIALAQSLGEDIDRLKADEHFSAMLDGAQLPDFNDMGDMAFDMTGGGSLPSDIVDSLKSADVTNITDRVKALASRMFADKTPSVIQEIQSGIGTGLDNVAAGLQELDKQIAGLQKGLDGVNQGLDGMTQGIAGTEKGIEQMTGTLAGLQAQLGAAPDAQKPALMGQIAGMQAAMEELKGKKADQEKSLAEARGKAAGMKEALAAMRDGRESVLALQAKMTQLRNAIPGEFQKARDQYLGKLEGMRHSIESAFQSGLNGGFRGMFLFVVVSSVLAAAVLAFYRPKAVQPA